MAEFHPAMLYGAIDNRPDSTNVYNVLLISTFGWFFKDEEVIVIPDHVATAKSLLIEQFKTKENINKLVEVFAQEWADIEMVLYQMSIDRWIDTAQGVQLDNVADIVGITRDSRDDDDLREAVRFQIFTNNSQGDPETVIKAVLEITNATSVDYSETYPAGIQVSTNGIVPTDFEERMKRVIPAGVSITLVP